MFDIKIYTYSDTNEKIYLEPIIQEDEEGYTKYTYKELKDFALHVKGKCVIDAGIDRLPMFGGGVLSMRDSEIVSSNLYVHGHNDISSSKITSSICDLTSVIIVKSNLQAEKGALFFSSSIRDVEIKADTIDITRARLHESKIKLNNLFMSDGDWTKLDISSTTETRLNIKARGTIKDGFKFKWDNPPGEGKEYTLVLADILAPHEQMEQLSGIYVSDITNDPCKINMLKLSHILVNEKVYGYDQILDLIKDLATKK